MTIIQEKDSGKYVTLVLTENLEEAVRFEGEDAKDFLKRNSLPEKEYLVIDID